jgi:hypothetical protein
VTLQLHYDLEIVSAPNRNQYQESSWGYGAAGKRVRPTTPIFKIVFICSKLLSLIVCVHACSKSSVTVNYYWQTSI